MTTVMLLPVAEFPTRSNSGDRLLFTSTAMWVAYIAENQALTLATFPRSVVTATNLPTPTTSTILASKTPRWANPTLISMGNNFAVIYQSGEPNSRNLMLTIVDSSGGILSSTPLGSAGYEIPFTCFVNSTGDFEIFAGYMGYVTHDQSSLIRHVVSAQTLQVSTQVIASYKWGIASLLTSLDSSDTPAHVVFATSTAIYTLAVGSITPQLVRQCDGEIVVEVTSTSNFGTTAVIYSAIINGKPLSPKLYYVYGTNAPVELSLQAGEAMSHCRIVYTGVDYKLYCVTQNVSAHPRSVFVSTIKNIFSVDQVNTPTSLDQIDYLRPFNLRSLSMEFGQSLLSETDVLQGHIRSGSLLLEVPGSPNSLLCYFDPLVSPITFQLQPPSISNQARGLLGVPTVQTLSIIANNPDGVPVQYQWTASSPEITFSSPYAAVTQSYFSYLTPDTATISVKVTFGESTSTLTLPVQMVPHVQPSMLSPVLSAAWHTPLEVTLSVAHDALYPVTLTCISADDISVGSSSSLPDQQLSYTFSESVKTATGSDFTVWFQPWHVDVMGGVHNLNFTLTDPLCTVSQSGTLTVSPFPPLLLGQGFLQRFGYLGNLRTANAGLGFKNIDPASGLISDFTDVKRLSVNGVQGYIFIGSHAVLWVYNWDVWTHIYLVSYDPIISATVNKFGETAILTGTEILLYDPSTTGITSSRTMGNAIGLPKNMTYQDVPTGRISLPVYMAGVAQSIRETSVPGIWIVATDTSVAVLRKDGLLDVFNEFELGLGPNDTVLRVYTERIVDAFNGFFVVFIKTSDTAYTGVQISLSDRSRKVVWKGESLASFISV